MIALNTPADWRVLFDRLTRGQRFLKVPADRLAFAVGVSREDQFVVDFQRIGNRFDVLFALAGDFPFHVKVVLSVY